MKVVAVVIWFNPTSQDLKNIDSYSKRVYKTIVVDNSSSDNSALVSDKGNVEYIPLNENKGIAAALNVGYRQAAELGASWVLTMDQDSSFLEEDIKNYLNLNADHFKESGVAVFGPNFEGPITNELIDCASVISSGSLVNLAAHQRNSGYNEDLFVDQVDHEYCCRLKILGYRILQVSHISMMHTIGSPLTKKIMGRVFVSYNHNADRKYYITRNMLYMRHHFGEFGDKHLKIIFMNIVNVIFIVVDKYNKLKSMLRGCFDFFMGRMGRRRV